MSPRLKNHKETENERSINRSRLRNDRIRLQSTSPSRKTPQNASQTERLLIFVPPNAPGDPRAIVHATCGPVHASRTVPVASSTLPVAISPAAPDQTLTVHAPSENVASVTGWGGYRF